MHLLSGLGLENFRTFGRRADFDLAPLTIITGPNSSGKSSVLKALNLLQASHGGSELDELDFRGGSHDLGSFETARSRGQDGAMIFTFSFPAPVQGITISNLKGGKVRLVDKKTARRNVGGKRSERPDKTVLLDSLGPFRLELTFKPSRDGGNYLSQVEFFGGYETICTIERSPEEGLTLPPGQAADPELQQMLREQGPVFLSRYRVRLETQWLLAKMDRDFARLDDVISLSSAAPEHAERLKMVVEGGLLFEVYKEPAPVLEVLREVLATVKGVVLPDDEGNRAWPKRASSTSSPTTDYDRLLDRFGKVEKEERAWNHDLLGHIHSLVHGAMGPVIDTLWERLGQALRSIEHTGTLRAYPNRIFLESDTGDDFRSLLETYSAGDDGWRKKRTQKWMQEFGLGDDVEVKRIADAGYTVTIHQDGQQFELADCGYGYTQLLPLILRAAVGGRGKSTLLIEEPEASLHPNLQSKVADLFLELAGKGNQLLVETHSEYLIRRLQFMIATGEADPEDVVIYYLGPDPEADDYIRKIEITKFGQLTQEFGPGFYDEATNLMVDLFKYGSQN